MREKFKKSVVALAVIIVGAMTFTACTAADDSEVVNHNIDKAAKNFEVYRRVVAVNTQTDSYLLSIEGRCDITPKKGRVLVTCKVADGDGADSYKRHQIYTTANRVAVVVEQLEAVKASAYHYRMTFKPQTIVPDVDFRGSTSDNPLSDKGDGQ